jgi:hypothetical protein
MNIDDNIKIEFEMQLLCDKVAQARSSVPI